MQKGPRASFLQVQFLRSHSNVVLQTFSNQAFSIFLIDIFKLYFFTRVT